jgi:hypothetical protein
MNQRQYEVTVVGPVAADPSWQARAGLGFGKGSFQVDSERQVVTCPAGKESISWLANTYPEVAGLVAPVVVPRINGMMQQVLQGDTVRAPPFELTTVGAVVRPDRHTDVVLDQIVEKELEALQ